MDIAIFGAGIAGLMTAITMRAQGHRYRIYERSRQALDAGMGFILVPEGIACMKSFGVPLAGALSGTPLERYFCRDATGRIIHEEKMPRGARGIRRRDLTTALGRALLPDEEPIFDAGLDRLEFDEQQNVTSALLHTVTGSTRLQADLYVSAEGINSRARQAMFHDWPSVPDRVPEIVGLVRCDKAVSWAGHCFNKFHAEGGGIALGILPVDKEHVVWYLQFDAQRYPLSPEALGNGSSGAEARRVHVQELVGSWAHPIPSLVAQTDFSQVHLWRPIETDLVPTFHRQNLVLVGDAAHPLSPFTSQGVSSAVADAVALAEAVSGKVSSQGELAWALDHYSRQRRAQCAPYIAKGRELTQHFLEPLTAGKRLLPIA
jgi:2-polyprenyl-6-methoxyphenol hydroxylase-like FAD-dependent oxidoreductase